VLNVLEKLIFWASLLFLPRLLYLLKENFVEYKRSKRFIKSSASKLIKYKEKYREIEPRNRTLKNQYQQLAGKTWNT